MKQLQIVLCSLLSRSREEEGGDEANVNGQGNESFSARKARCISPANAGNSFFVERS